MNEETCDGPEARSVIIGFGTADRPPAWLSTWCNRPEPWMFYEPREFQFQSEAVIHSQDNQQQGWQLSNWILSSVLYFAQSIPHIFRQFPWTWTGSDSWRSHMMQNYNYLCFIEPQLHTQFLFWQEAKLKHFCGMLWTRGLNMLISGDL